MRRSATVALALCVADVALAHTGEVFGLGSRSSAQAGAVVASATDFSAAYYNPAGPAFSRGGELTLGASYFASRLQIDGERRAIENPVGILFGAQQRIPLGGPLADRLTVALAFSFLPDQLVRVIARRPGDAFFPLYDNRTQRLIALPALAIRLHERLAIGVGLNLLATLDGDVVATEGAQRTITPRLDEQIRTRLRFAGGLRWRTTGRLNVGLAYRQKFAVSYATRTRNTISGEPLDFDVRADGLFTPHQVVAGAAYTFAPGLRCELDAAYLRWSDYAGPYVEVDSALPLLPPVSANLPHLEYRDIWAVRAAAEWQFHPRVGRVELRAGAHLEPSPIPDQPGVSNQIDGTKLAWALGGGVPLGRLPLRIDGHVLVQHVLGRTLDKRLASCSWDGNLNDCPRTDPADSLIDEDVTTKSFETSNIGYPSISGGGLVVAAGMTLTVELK